jgi:hypothetical protein
MPRADLIPRLMPRMEAQVTRRGIEIAGVRYFSSSALLQRLVHEASLRGKATPIKVACDPNNTNEIFLVNPQTKSGFETIPIAANSPYTGMTFEEVRRQRRAEEERRKYLQGLQGVTGVDEERIRQERTAEAQHERNIKVAASAETLSSPAAQTPAESKAGEISAQLEQERAANATVPSPEPTNGAQRQPSEGVSKPIARRVLRLLQLNPPDENP